MSNKTTYKRIALAVVASLGFGVLASGSSNAVVAGPTLAIAAGTGSTATGEASIAVGETATVLITANWSNVTTSDSFIVTGILSGTSKPTSDSTSVVLEATTDSANVVVAAGAAPKDAPRASTDAIWSFANGTANTASKMVFKFSVKAAEFAGTYTYTFYATTDTTGETMPAPVTFKLTVTGKDRVIASATSLIGQGTTAAVGSDSLVTVSGLGAAAQVANIFATVKNAAGETTSVTGGFTESITAVVTGPGLIAVDSDADGSSGAGTAARSVAFNAGSYLIVYNDGTAGTSTITLYKGLTSTVLATETVSFSGTAASATLALGHTATSKQASDSQTVVRLVVKDALGNALPSTTNKWYVHSSDTSVIANHDAVTNCTYSYSSTLGYATCGLTIGDTGTTKIKIANFAYGTAAASLPTTQIVSNELDLRVVGSAASVSVAFDKTAYAKGEEATLTLTVKDANGFVVPSQTVASLLAAGIDLTPGTDVTDTSITLTKGIKTFTAEAPMVSGSWTAVYKGGAGLPTAGQLTDTQTVTVIDLAEEAANSALDAAQEATDAAIAATDAAILAQEAADEAASAAIAAQETAQAAVDAVTALSAEVTKLVAQLATVQKLVRRVAKKVGVKL